MEGNAKIIKLINGQKNSHNSRSVAKTIH